VSAHTRAGLPELVETINAIAEVRDLRAETTGIASEGRIIESHVDRGRGNVATVIVTRGTLEIGATIIAGTAFAKVRQLASGDGQILTSAGPGTPIEVTGWKDLPEAGDEVLEAQSEEDAKRAVENRRRRREKARTMDDLEIINEKRRIEAEAETLLKNMQDEAKKAGADRAATAAIAADMSARSSKNGVKELVLIVKSDFNGTLEAVCNSLSGIGNNEARVKIVSQGVGDVSDGDLAMAKATDGDPILINCQMSCWHPLTRNPH
jgi:translation initiation factor IF-2